MSDLYQIWLKSSSDNAGKKIWNSSWLVKPFLNNAWTNLTKSTEKWMWGYLPTRVWCIETKLGVCYNNHDLRLLVQFLPAPPSGQEIWKWLFLLITSEWFGQKTGLFRFSGACRFPLSAILGVGHSTQKVCEQHHLVAKSYKEI